MTQKHIMIQKWLKKSPRPCICLLVVGLFFGFCFFDFAFCWSVTPRWFKSFPPLTLYSFVLSGFWFLFSHIEVQVQVKFDLLHLSLTMIWYHIIWYIYIIFTVPYLFCFKCKNILKVVFDWKHTDWNWAVDYIKKKRTDKLKRESKRELKSLNKV